MTQPPKLGRGLSALFNEDSGNGNEVRGQEKTLSLSDIRPNPHQPRTHFSEEDLNDLIQSIKQSGLLQPLLVRPKDHHYEIIAGERRWRAAKLAQLEQVPVIVRECSDEEALILALVENIQRSDLNPVEEGEAYNQLIRTTEKTQEQVATMVGKSRSYVANMVRLTSLPDSVKQLIKEGKISAGHARALLKSENIEEKVMEAIQGNLTVRDLERKVKDQRTGAQPNEQHPRSTISVPENEDILSVEENLRRTLGLNVKVKLGQKGGTLTIFFNTYEQMDLLLEKLG